jgi:hypothetical protein
MNPLSLLTKGRTFIGFKNRPSAYKLAKGMVVPNFSADKGSFPSATSAPPTPSHREAAVSQHPISQPTLFPQLETQTPAQTQLNAQPAGHTKSPATVGTISDLETVGDPITPAQAGGESAPTGILSYDSMPMQPQRTTKPLQKPAQSLPKPSPLQSTAATAKTVAGPTDIPSYDGMPKCQTSQLPPVPPVPPVPPAPAPRDDHSVANFPAKSAAKSPAKPVSNSQPAPVSMHRPGPVRFVRSLLPEATHNISSRVGAVCQQFLRRWSAARKAHPFQVPAVQTELALDKVTVVRNDLSEYDLEVVGMGKKKSAQYDQCQALSTNR